MQIKMTRFSIYIHFIGLDLDARFLIFPRPLDKIRARQPCAQMVDEATAVLRQLEP